MKNNHVFGLITIGFLVIGLLSTVFIAKNTCELSKSVKSLQQRLDRQNMEYQLIINNCDSITIYDKERYVGTVKVEGELDSLLLEDNK